MLRLQAAILAMTLAPAAALASSFTTAGPRGDGPTPSIVRLGEPSASTFLASAVVSEEVDPDEPRVIDAPEIFTISPSVIAIGIGAIPGARQDVAAADDDEWRDEPAPQVIRGGLVGSAFATPEPAAPAEDGELSDLSPEEAVQEPQPAQEPVKEVE